MNTSKEETALARRRAQNREAQRKFRRKYYQCKICWDEEEKLD
jgi:hypothetical protein